MVNDIRWGILGTASICDAVVPAIQAESHSRCVAIASRSVDKATNFARKFSIEQAFGSYEGLLTSGAIDAVYLPLPNSLHAKWAISALKSGLHVLCEKPLALNAEQAREIMQAAEKSGKLIAEGYMYRHHRLYEKLLELIAEGIIGRVNHLHSEFSFLLDEDDSIVTSSELGGGALMDVGCYCVNFSRLIAGCEPQRVSACGRIDQVDTTMTGWLQFPDGLVATFATSIESAERHRAEIHGEFGRLVLDSPWHPGETKASLRLQKHEEEDEVFTVGGENAYAAEVRDFTDACRGARPLRWGIKDAVANMEVLDALALSAKSGETVSVG